MRTSGSWWKALPERYQALMNPDAALSTRRIDTGLLHLMAVRAAQLTGCRHCQGVHAQLARTAHVPDEKLAQLAAWREAAAYTERERAALAWTEAVTRAEAH
jgi:AhpD family alkylhydroperoxidase